MNDASLSRILKSDNAGAIRGGQMLDSAESLVHSRNADSHHQKSQSSAGKMPAEFYRAPGNRPRKSAGATRGIRIIADQTWRAGHFSAAGAGAAGFDVCRGHRTGAGRTGGPLPDGRGITKTGSGLDCGGTRKIPEARSCQTAGNARGWGRAPRREEGVCGNHRAFEPRGDSPTGGHFASLRLRSDRRACAWLLAPEVRSFAARARNTSGQSRLV